ncbi:DEAD/DEAH box helicase [Eubacteriales bacterium OttesenSCG-928-A19]|nr:DEAD/DEAH box helicase [Eubacteriales bacterium OttesenSCG-928-A19]
MGTGKTITSIAIAGALYLSRKIRRVLVVAPLSIVGVWEEEFDKFADFPYTLQILTGTGAKKAAALEKLHGDPLQVAVINYESAWRLEQEITGWHPDLIIADEGHKIKTHNTTVSKAMHRLGAKTPYRLLLTGTVITNKALDVFSQYKFLNPAVFGNSFYAFRGRYFYMTGYGNHTPVLKKSMEPELMARIHSIAFRATKAECLDLPAITEMVRTVELEPAAMRIYKDLVEESYAALGQSEVTVTNILTRLLRLSQLTGGFVTTDDGSLRQASTAKLAALEDIVEEVLQEGRKLVIIARFLPEINAIRRMLEKHKIGYACITGEVRDRAEQVQAFQTDPEVQVFIGQIATAGLGITLTAASTMVFYSADYSMSNFEQARARIHRVGQTENCTYIYLSARNTVDGKVLKALRAKADLARMLVDDYRQGRNPFS